MNISLTNSTGRSLEKFVNREFLALYVSGKINGKPFQWTVHQWNLSLSSSVAISVNRLFTSDSTNGQFLGNAGNGRFTGEKSTGSSLANTGQWTVHWQTPVNGQFTGKHRSMDRSLTNTGQWTVHWQTLVNGQVTDKHRSMDSSLANTVHWWTLSMDSGQFTSEYCQWTIHWWTLSMDSSLVNTVNGQFTGEHCQWTVHWWTL